MKRSKYWDYIEEKLNVLATRINSRGKLNILNLNIKAENFYVHFFNKLYDWNLTNLNAASQNVEALDLVDDVNKLIVQVSATSTKEKIESSLKKDSIKNYKTYQFKFISISKDASKLRKKTFNNPHNINFAPLQDIIDTHYILNYVLSLDIDKQKEMYNFIKKELGTQVDLVKLDSNLAAIINVLSQEDLTIEPVNELNTFEIDRKISHNQLDKTKYLISDYSVHHTRLERIYGEFDKQGVNKSFSVLELIKKIYIKENTKLTGKVSDKIFLQVLESVKNKILESANYVDIPIDELELCVNIVVVDAFIRCKIFENPESYNHAITQ